MKLCPIHRAGKSAMNGAQSLVLRWVGRLPQGPGAGVPGLSLNGSYASVSRIEGTAFRSVRRLSLRALKPGFGSILLWLRCLLADRNREQTSGPEGLARSAGILLGVETPGSLRNGSLWAVETAAFAGMGRSAG
jgi:hypothetical protein